MEVRLLEKGYKNNEQFYQDFLDDTLKDKDEYFSVKVVTILDAPDFPIYMGKGSEEEKKRLFHVAFEVLTESYLQIPREFHFDELFWHSLLTVYKRDFLLQNYPQITEGINHFKNIAIKDFNFENYIYKCVLGAQYISDIISDPNDRKRYYDLIVDNLDMYNYMIKYEIFRNDRFILNILEIIDELNISKVVKSKITGRDDLGKDERVGRRVIFEFNKSYPVIMSPMLEKEELKELFLQYLGYYYDTSKLQIHEHV